MLCYCRPPRTSVRNATLPEHLLPPPLLRQISQGEVGEGMSFEEHDDDRDRLASLADCMLKREPMALPPSTAPALQVDKQRTRTLRGYCSWPRPRLISG